MRVSLAGGSFRSPTTTTSITSRRKRRVDIQKGRDRSEKTILPVIMLLVSPGISHHCAVEDCIAVVIMLVVVLVAVGVDVLV